MNTSRTIGVLLIIGAVMAILTVRQPGSGLWPWVITAAATAGTHLSLRRAVPDWAIGIACLAVAFVAFPLLVRLR